MARRYDTESSDDDEPRHRSRYRREILLNYGGGRRDRGADDSGSSDSEVDRRNHRRYSGREERDRNADRQRGSERREGSEERDRRANYPNNDGGGGSRDGGDDRINESSDSDVDRRNHRRGGGREDRDRDAARRGSERGEGGEERDRRDSYRNDVSGSGRKGGDVRDSESSDSDVDHRNHRCDSGRGERDRNVNRRQGRGSEERDRRDSYRNNGGGNGGRKGGDDKDSESSDSDVDRCDRRHGSGREERGKDRDSERERGSGRQEREEGREVGDQERDRHRRLGSEKHEQEAGGERWGRDRDEIRKRYEKEDEEVLVTDGRVTRRRDDSENDVEEQGRRGGRRESERPSRRNEVGAEEVLVTDDLNMKRGGDKEKDDRGESNSEGFGERDKKTIERRGEELSIKRMQVVEEDKEPNVYRKDRIKRDAERRRGGRGRYSDSESSGSEHRRHKRGRERRRHRDEDNSSNSDGRRKRDRKGERKDRSRNDRRRDHEDGEMRSRRDRIEKGGVEYKQEGKDSKAAGDVVKPQVQPNLENENPGGALGTLGRTGGVYIPPFKLARMMKEVEDKSSVEYQRLTWDALRKSINGLVNKVNATNIKNIIPELFSENLIRGRGLFCRSCMKSQMASPGFTDVFAALVAVVNTRFPEIGDLLLRRIVLQLKRAYKRNDKPQLIAAVKFIAHLVNQQVAHELVALELLTILLENPTDDSVEVAVDFVKECGSILQDLCPKGLHGIFERFRGILHEGEIDKRVQFLIEGLFAIRKSKFQGHPAVRPELDLVEPEDQLTHEISLDDHIDPETSLDIFRQDPNFVENERKYEDLKKSILGDESEDEEVSDAGSNDDEDEDDEDEDEDEDEEQMQIKDETETNLINLRRTIYLTIMSSVDFEEAGHKLLKIKLEPGQEMELCIMLLECCSQERTYLRYYGLLGQRFCMINKVHQENFEKCFVQQYSMIHRLETNKLRNVAKFFAHLLGTDALPWNVLAYIRLTEEDTTSSSRIFIKILFQELSEHLGIRLLNERLNDPAMADTFESIFPKDNPRNTRFSINFFTSIGLGGLTENLREYLKNMPRMIMQQQKPESDEESGPDSGSISSGSESSSSESDSGSSSSDESDSDHDRRRKRRKRK